MPMKTKITFDTKGIEKKLEEIVRDEAQRIQNKIPKLCPFCGGAFFIENDKRICANCRKEF